MLIRPLGLFSLASLYSIEKQLHFQHERDVFISRRQRITLFLKKHSSRPHKFWTIKTFYLNSKYCFCVLQSQVNSQFSWARHNDTCQNSLRKYFQSDYFICNMAVSNHLNTQKRICLLILKIFFSLGRLKIKIARMQLLSQKQSISFSDNGFSSNYKGSFNFRSLSEFGYKKNRKCIPLRIFIALSLR